MSDKPKLKYFDPQITIKDKAVGDRLQYIPGTKLPMPSDIEISESGMCNRNVTFALEVILIMNMSINL